MFFGIFGGIFGRIFGAIFGATGEFTPPPAPAPPPAFEDYVAGLEFETRSNALISEDSVTHIED